jgi:signal transduction histidine kinase
MGKVLLFFIFFLHLFFASAQSNQNLFAMMQLQLEKGKSAEKAVAALYLSDFFSGKQLDSALYFAEKGIRYANQSKNDSLLAKALNTKAVTFEYKGVLDSSLLYHQKALKKRMQLKDYIGIADSYNNIGVVTEQKGQLREAAEWYFKALKIYEKSKDSSKIAMTNSNLGITYKQMQSFEKALQFYTKANLIYQKIKDDFGITVTSGNIGSVNLDLKNYPAAMEYSKKAAIGYEKHGYKRYVPYAESNYAIALDSLKMFSLAEKAYLKVLKNHKEFGNDSEYINISNALAQCYIKQKKYQQSQNVLNEIEPLIGKNSTSRNQLKYLQNRAKTWFGLNQTQKAYSFLEQYVSMKDTLLEKEKVKAIFELETQYETTKKQKQLVETKAAVAAKEFKIKQRNNQLLLLALLLAASLLIAFFIYKQQKWKEQQLINENKLQEAMYQMETQKQLQVQRSNISRDLHDNIGAQLTFIISSLRNIKYLFSEEQPKLNLKIEEIAGFAQYTITELRDTIWAMNLSKITIEDIQSRLYNFLEKAKSSNHAISIDFQIEDNVDLKIAFTALTGMHIFRILQEALHNALKYAKPSKLAIKIWQKDSKICFTVKDDGIGFDVNQVTEGNGLRNMQSRAETIGATFILTSSINQGTIIEFQVPFK